MALCSFYHLLCLHYYIIVILIIIELFLWASWTNVPIISCFSSVAHYSAPHTIIWTASCRNARHITTTTSLSYLMVMSLNSRQASTRSSPFLIIFASCLPLKIMARKFRNFLLFISLTLPLISFYCFNYYYCCCCWYCQNLIISSLNFLQSLTLSCLIQLVPIAWTVVSCYCNYVLFIHPSRTKNHQHFCDSFRYLWLIALCLLFMCKVIVLLASSHISSTI